MAQGVQINVSRRKNPATNGYAYGGNIKLTGKIELDQLIEEIVSYTSVTPSDVKGIIASYVEQAIYALRNAQPIELENIGTLTLSLKSGKTATKDEFDATRLKSIRPAFRACQKFMKEVSKENMTFSVNKNKLTTGDTPANPPSGIG